MPPGSRQSQAMRHARIWVAQSGTPAYKKMSSQKQQDHRCRYEPAYPARCSLLAGKRNCKSRLALAVYDLSTSSCDARGGQKNFAIRNR